MGISVHVSRINIMVSMYQAEIAYSKIMLSNFWTCRNRAKGDYSSNCCVPITSIGDGQSGSGNWYIGFI